MSATFPVFITAADVTAKVLRLLLPSLLPLTSEQASNRAFLLLQDFEYSDTFKDSR